MVTTLGQSGPLPKLRHRFIGALVLVCTITYLGCSTWKPWHALSTQNTFHIPKTIWQIWIHPSKQPSDDLRDLSRTWIDANPGWDYVSAILNHSSAEAWVQEVFNHRQDIVDAFMMANETIHKADFLRYLLLLEEGGVYTDLDTRCLKPIEDWVPAHHREHTGLVIGIEIDDLLEGNYDINRPYLQLCQWTIMARPHHPAMERVVDSVIARIQSWDGDVMEITGPQVFTEAVFESLSELSGRDNEMLRDEIDLIQEPYRIGDVLILPVNAFGSGQAHSGSKNPKECNPFVVHSFAGSWRPENQT